MQQRVAENSRKERLDERWTIFYWAWGVSWAPFVGSFIARISRGRTIREFVLGVIGVPVLLSVIWFATFGGSALYFELFESAGISEAVAREVSSGLFATLDLLPAAGILSLAMLVLIVLFVITSANSATFVLGMFTGKGVLTPARMLRATWGRRRRPGAESLTPPRPRSRGRAGRRAVGRAAQGTPRSSSARIARTSTSRSRSVITKAGIR